MRKRRRTVLGDGGFMGALISSVSAPTRRRAVIAGGPGLVIFTAECGLRCVIDQPPLSGPGGMLVKVSVDCSPSLDQVAGLFPASSGQRGPYATDRSISSIGALLPIALRGRPSHFRRASSRLMNQCA